MAYADVSLQSTDIAKTSTGPVSLGGTRGGGMEFNFGGINDSPTGKWLWIGLAIALTGGLALFYFNRKKSK
ncbi:MAG: hypothetical protein RL514_3504 [Verrucomicrobiota bacterium]|jgi:LPXTG-motif cell wall-anchored protein